MMEFLKHLEDTQIKHVHDAAKKVLCTVGMKLYDETLLVHLQNKGMKVNDSTVLFNEEEIERALLSAKREVLIYDYAGRATALSAGTVLPAIYANAVNIYDEKQKTMRPATSDDLTVCMKLAQEIDEIRLACAACIAGDVPLAHQSRVEIGKVMTMCDKTTLCAPKDAKEASLWIGASRIAYRGGGADEKPMIMTLSPASPLRMDRQACRVMQIAAGGEIPLLISPCPMSGATAPYTMAGTMVLTHAEFLGMLTIYSQLTENPCVIYGGSAAPMNLQYGVLCYGAPERNTLLCANIDIANYFSLPHFSAAGSVHAVSPNFEAGYEKALSTVTRLTKGTMMGLWFGSLDNGSAISFEQVVMDAEVYRSIVSMLRPINFEGLSQAVDAIIRVGPGGDYMTDAHTLQSMRSDEYVFSPILSDFHKTREEPTAYANKKVLDIVHSYESRVPKSVRWDVCRYLELEEQDMDCM